MKNTLETDRTFLSLSVPLRPEQEGKLEKSLLQSGCLEPIITWNGVIIDGYKRYRICTAEGIDFSFEEMSFPSAEEAIFWVCRKRIPDYEKASVPYRYLVGRFYNAQKEIYREARKQPEDIRRVQIRPEWPRVSYYTGEELHLNHATVEVYGAYASAMEQIADKAWNLFEALLTGTVTATRKKILEYASLDANQLTELCRYRLKLEKDKESALRIRARRERRQMQETAEEIPLSVGVKEMPAYDPDMELRGLALTIPSWVMAMSRVEEKMETATEDGKAQLFRSLKKLEEEIIRLLGVMEHGRE